jgi:hypothetical protein
LLRRRGILFVDAEQAGGGGLGREARGFVTGEIVRPSLAFDQVHQGLAQGHLVHAAWPLRA